MRVTRKVGKVDALRQTVKTLDRARGKVGWFPSAKYEDGAPVAGIAHVQEFGSPSQGVPPRLGMRYTARENEGQWKGLVGQFTRAAAQGKLPPGRVMEALTLAAEGTVRAHITKITTPPLKPATIATRKRRLANGGVTAKASIAKPLVDTGILLNTLTSEVDRK